MGISARMGGQHASTGYGSVGMVGSAGVFGASPGAAMGFSPSEFMASTPPSWNEGAAAPGQQIMSSMGQGGSVGGGAAGPLPGSMTASTAAVAPLQGPLGSPPDMDMDGMSMDL